MTRTTTLLTQLVPAWHVLVAPAFHLVTLTLLACYVSLLIDTGVQWPAALMIAATICLVADARVRSAPVAPTRRTTDQMLT